MYIPLIAEWAVSDIDGKSKWQCLMYCEDAVLCSEQE